MATKTKTKGAAVETAQCPECGHTIDFHNAYAKKHGRFTRTLAECGCGKKWYKSPGGTRLYAA